MSSNDFIIIDFEGEPARPLAERRIKHSSLRDVAGMLRSFDYARWSAVLRDTYTEADRARLAPLAQGWVRETRETFLRAYDETTRDSGLYASFAEVQGLIELFELEKALYELRYEVGNRPAWINVPLQGVLALCGLAPDAGTDNAYALRRRHDMDKVDIMLEPVQAFLIQIAEFLPKLAVALGVLIAGWLLAKFAMFAIVKGLARDQLQRAHRARRPGRFSEVRAASRSDTTGSWACSSTGW